MMSDRSRELVDREQAAALAEERLRECRVRHAALVRDLKGLLEAMRAEEDSECGGDHLSAGYWADKLDQLLAAHPEPPS